MRVDDGELVEQAWAGDSSAFSELVGRYRDAVCGLAYHHLGSFEEAQDAAQEAFVRAYTRLGQLRQPAKFAPWLRRIAASICVEVLRRRAGRAISLDAEQVASAASVSAASATEEADRATARIVVRQALSSLSEKARLAVTLYYINGYSHSEIAGFLDVPITTVRTRLHRAKKRLREEMVAMVTDVLQDGRPDESFTQEVVNRAFSYAAIQETTGAWIEGTGEAASEHEIVCRLEAKGYRVTRIAPAPDLSNRTKAEQDAERQEAAAKLADAILREGLRNGAESIAVSRQRRAVSVSYLIGSESHEVMSVPTHTWAPLRALLARMAGVALRYGAAPEPGRITYEFEGEQRVFDATFRRTAIQIRPEAR